MTPPSATPSGAPDWQADVVTARAIIAEGRRSHVEWAAHLRHCPGCDECKKLGVDWDWTREQAWVEKYDFLLRVLDQAAGQRAARAERGKWKSVPDKVCEHGTALDVHCCNCHSGFLFDADSCVCSFEKTNADVLDQRSITIADAAFANLYFEQRNAAREEADDLRRQMADAIEEGIASRLADGGAGAAREEQASRVDMTEDEYLAKVKAIRAALLGEGVADPNHPPTVELARQARAARAEAEGECRRLREALIAAAIPLEALHAAEHDGWALADEVKRAVATAVVAIRAALTSPEGGEKGSEKR